MKTFNDHCNCGRESSLVESNVYRVGSEKYFEYWRNIRKEYYAGNVMIESHEVDIMESDLGEFGTFNGENVALDCIFEDDKQDVINQPKRGGEDLEYYVYVKDPSTGNVKKVSWGDTSGLKVKLNDPVCVNHLQAVISVTNKTTRQKCILGV